MPNLFKDIEEFHKKFGLEYEEKPRVLNSEMHDFRVRFLREELDEYEGSAKIARRLIDNPHLQGSDQASGDFAMALEDSLDALVDLVYVALGTAYLHGFDFQEAWDRVHRANMAKVRAQSASESKRGTAYDIVKPEGWQPPRHTDLVQDHAHSEVFNK